MSAQPNESRYPALPGFAKENRTLVYAMVDAGWTGRMTSKGHFLAKAPDGKKQITVPAKNGNNRGLANAKAAFTRWLKDTLPPEVQEVDRAAAEFLQESREAAGPTVVETRPWLARKSPGKDGGFLYPSKAVLERHWSDGTTDYVCSECEYESKSPRSVAAHYGGVHSEGRSEQNPPTVIDPTYTEPVHSGYRPTERMVDTLMSVLNDILNDTADMRETAVRLLTWMNDRPDIDHEPRPVVPLSDRQTLDKIRLLVGQPDQTETIERLTRERDEANARLVKVERDLSGLRDLIEGIGR